ncbi:hypothetical protein D9619_008326 [Psilocybe cf. subviscida]|uniref:Uncharacterized protein n=1 Tax=Psilocybe cf. subviscida TaxID=2480587 RepID=A0A8H5BBP6_9AGAR|nr:hypothetical protein D9619_008326 [Psilocybe cf. subviscida]
MESPSDYNEPKSVTSPNMRRLDADTDLSIHPPSRMSHFVLASELPDPNLYLCYPLPAAQTIKRRTEDGWRPTLCTSCATMEGHGRNEDDVSMRFDSSLEAMGGAGFHGIDTLLPRRQSPKFQRVGR